MRNRSKWTWRETGMRGRNGKPIREVLLESMGPEWTRKWAVGSGQERLAVGSGQWADEDAAPEGSLTTELASSPVSFGDVDGDDGLDAEIGQKDGGEDRLTQALARYRPELRGALLEEAQRLASIVERYDAVSPKRRLAVGGGQQAAGAGGDAGGPGKYEFVPEVLTLADEARCVDPVVLAVEPSRGKAKSPHTLDAWSKEFRELGLAAFLRKPPEPTGRPDGRKAQISAAAMAWIENNRKKFQSPTKLYQELKRQATRRGWVIPSRGWVWRQYDALPELVRTAWYDGRKAYVGRYAPFLQRTVEDLTALEILCGDHSVRDVMVMLPDGSLTRPWLTLWQDLRTGLLWGWHLDIQPSSATIALAYVNGVQTFGAQPFANPETGYQSYLYTDQGKDYKCKTLAGQWIRFEKAARIEGGLKALCAEKRVGFIDEMGLKHIMARGYNAREKAVERTHRDISAWEQNTFEIEYCGKDTASRPERFREACAKHEKLLKKWGKQLHWVREGSPFMTLDDYRDNLAGWIDEYNRSGHVRSVLGGSTTVPIREYERLYTHRYEISDEALALMLMKTDTRSIGKNGIRMFQQNWWYWHEAMSLYKGEENLKLEVRYTDGDYSRVWVVLPARPAIGLREQVVEASLITPSSIKNPNKKSLGQVKEIEARENRLIREYHQLQQSQWRGESTADRVAAMIGEDAPDEAPETQRIAVNDRPQVIALTRFDKPKLAAAPSPSVTAEDVERARGSVIAGSFGKGERDDDFRIREEWE